MSEWVDEWMGCENSKYEALSTKYYSLLIKNNGAHTPLCCLRQQTRGYRPRIDANSSAIQAHWVMANSLRPRLLGKPAICQGSIVLEINLVVLNYVNLNRVRRQHWYGERSAALQSQVANLGMRESIVVDA